MTSDPPRLKLKAYRSKKAFEEAWLNFRARSHPNPLFIFGNQKSGTSAIAALIGACTDLDVSLDFPREILYPTVPDVHRGRIDLQSFIRRNRLSFSRPIIKEPSITFLAEALLETYPRSEAIFVTRHPFENIRSILDRLGIPGDRESLAPVDLQDVSRTWMTVLDNRWQGVEAEHYIGQLAERWVAAARICQRLDTRIHLVRYEDFELDKEGVIRKLARKVAFEPLKSIEHLVDVQYQPPGSRGRSAQEVYGSNLDIINESCWPLATDFGYERSGQAVSL